MSDASALAGKWAQSFERVRPFVVNAHEELADRLVALLVMAKLDWAHPTIREAATLRGAQIIDEIGWPKKAWLEKRVAAEVAYRNSIREWMQGGCVPSQFPHRQETSREG